MSEHRGPPAPTTRTFRSFQDADAPAAARLVTDSVRGLDHPPERRESADPPRRRPRAARRSSPHGSGPTRSPGHGRGGTHAGAGGTVLNLPMLRVNARLGYRVERMWVTWERPLSG